IAQVNLSDFFHEAFGFSKVADPKLFIMNDEVCGSFNTSHATDTPNELVFFKLKDKKVSQYFVCNYNNRMKTEKNWAFYSLYNELFVLYSLSPLRVLKAESFGLHAITFKDFYVNENQDFTNYSIGSPLVEVDV